MANEVNFTKLAYQINQAYGCANFPNIIDHTSNITLADLAIGNNNNNIGIVDTYYSDMESYVANSLARTDGANFTSGTAGAQHKASNIRDTNPGNPVPYFETTFGNGEFGGSCKPVALGNTISFKASGDYRDGSFAVAGHDGDGLKVDIYQVDSTLKPNYLTGIYASDCPFTPTLSNIRLFTSEHLTDYHVGNYSSNPNIKYIILFAWVSAGGGTFDYYIETFYYNTATNEIYSDNYTPSTSLVSGMDFRLSYAGKNDIIHPCVGDSATRRNIYVSPLNNDTIYGVDITNVSAAFGTNTPGNAMAYSTYSDIFCLYDDKNNLFKTYYNGVTLSSPTDTISQTIGNCFDADWNLNARASATGDTFYFGDKGSITYPLYYYTGYAVNTDLEGVIIGVESNTITDPGSRNNVYFNSIRAVQPYITVWGGGPNVGQQLLRMCHSDDKAYRSSDYALYPTGTTQHEDFIVLHHLDCADCAGQLGTYKSYELSGLPSATGNNNILITTYNNHIKLYSANYLVESQGATNTYGSGGHHHYIIELGKISDITSPSGYIYVCIAIQGLTATFGGSNGSYMVVKFNAA